VATLGAVARVEYQNVAETYQAGRDSVAQVGDWRKVTTFPETEQLRVVDIGSGTGIFLRAWPLWGATHVVGIDPSSAMLSEAARIGLPESTCQIVARAEQVPLKSNSHDAAWLSTVIHHFEDRRVCVGEIARLLVPGGRVYIRGHFTDLSWIEWMEYFPGSERALARFPSAQEVIGDFEASGFHFVKTDVVQGQQATVADVRTWIETMRHADTLLTAFADSEIAAGIENLEDHGPESLGSGLHLVTLQLGP
jgi:SAM-dependent methyltransferase